MAAEEVQTTLSATAAAFEDNLSELERLVKELERGDLPLERGLELFEKGMKLSVACKEQLEAAETRVEVLVKRGANVVAVPLALDATKDESHR